MNELHFTGTQINYFFLCKRKLWLFSHHIQMEQESDVVRLGKVIHETSYERERKEIDLEPIKLDWLDFKDGILHEVKKDDSFEEAHEWQVLYYLYFLKQKGVRVQESKSNGVTECKEEGNSKGVTECNSTKVIEDLSRAKPKGNSSVVTEFNEGGNNHKSDTNATIALNYSSTIALLNSSTIELNLELKGEIDYPKLKKKVQVILTPEKEKQLIKILEDIERIVALSQPPPIEVKFSLCKKCSYLELCHA